MIRVRMVGAEHLLVDRERVLVEQPSRDEVASRRARLRRLRAVSGCSGPRPSRGSSARARRVAGPREVTLSLKHAGEDAKDPGLIGMLGSKHLFAYSRRALQRAAAPPQGCPGLEESRITKHCPIYLREAAIPAGLLTQRRSANARQSVSCDTRSASKPSSS